jgi:hypothetical protein
MQEMRGFLRPLIVGARWSPSGRSSIIPLADKKIRQHLQAILNDMPTPDSRRFDQW